MEIKYSILGQLIYVSFGAYLLAFLFSIVRLRKLGLFFFLVGFLGCLAAYAHRWYIVGHIPMQNLFEVFLTLGVIIYPLSFFSTKILRTGEQAFDMILGAFVLFPAGFVFSELPQDLPPTLQSPFFAPHVTVYMLAYVFMAKAAGQAVLQIFSRRKKADLNLPNFEEETYRLTCAGFPLLTLGLILGSVWGKLAWGNWWNWDPKEMWSLACLLVYAGYFHFRFMFGRRYPRINSIWVAVGFAFIVITLLWVNLSRLFPGLHSYAY
jgi:ABC-type transport system involved in cytochrome c biogenesis permease subunit